MLIKGDKIKLVKTIGNFDKVGDIFEIIGINELGTITIASSYGTGIMSYDEFEKYFKKVEEEPLVWSEWKDMQDEYMRYRTNGKTIEMIDDLYKKKVKSTCLEEDVFDLDRGLKLCEAKLEVINTKSEIRKANKAHRTAIKELNKILREM